MKIILCGGGTSGHITPSLAIAEAFKRLLPDTQLLFIGRKDGKENEAVTSAGIRLTEISIRGLRRSASIENLRILSDALKARSEAGIIISDFAPDAVIGTGGYVCWPVISAAQKMNIPTFIHESNAVSGLTTRMVSKGCRAVFLGVNELKDKFPNGIYTGNPLRAEFLKETRASARKKLGISSDKRLIISVGGSLGAERMNTAAIALMKDFSTKNNNITHIHICGHRYYDNIKADEPSLCAAKSGSRIIPFTSDMPTLLHAADLAITRCGAMTISEIGYCHVPAILVPSPNVSSDHQRKNAYAYRKIGAATVIEDDELTGARLISEARKIIDAPTHFDRMQNTAKTNTFCDPGESIVKTILSMIK